MQFTESFREYKAIVLKTAKSTFFPISVSSSAKHMQYTEEHKSSEWNICNSMKKQSQLQKHLL